MEIYLDKIIDKIETSSRPVCRELIDFCLSLPLKPKKVNKPNISAVDFMNTTNNNMIFRIGILENGTIVFKLRYYASQDYSELFHQVIRDEISVYKGEWIGCYQCGKENGTKKKQCHTRYIVQMTDGKAYIRCGFAPVSIESVTISDLPEIKRLIIAQNTFFHEKLDQDEYVNLNV